MRIPQTISRLTRKAPAFISAGALMAASIVLPTGSAGAVSSCSYDLLGGITPTTTDYSADSSAVNVGMKFNVRGAASVEGVRFYKGSGNTGTHVAHLYDISSATNLASATFTGETSSGWQSVSFSSSVDVKDADNYMVWVSMPNGNYAIDGGYPGGPYSFSSHVFSDWQDVAFPTGTTPGVYSYSGSDSTVPANANTANYWVSPVVNDTTTPANNTGFSATDHTAGPSLAWTGIGYETNSVTSNASPAITTITRQASGGSEVVIGQQSGGASTWFDGQSVAPTDPTALPGTSYTYRVKNESGCGTVSSGTSASVTTSSQSLDNVFGSTAPATTASSDTGPVTLGNTFNTSVSGQVWGVRFYRDSGVYPLNGDNLQVFLWDASGNLLGRTILPQNNQQSGWIDARFSSPVSISSGQNYTVGYYAPDGKYSYTSSEFTSAVTSGDGKITMVQDSGGSPNGTYTYGAGYHHPSSTYNSTWYGLDVDFIPGS